MEINLLRIEELKIHVDQVFGISCRCRGFGSFGGFGGFGFPVAQAARHTAVTVSFAGGATFKYNPAALSMAEGAAGGAAGGSATAAGAAGSAQALENVVLEFEASTAVKEYLEAHGAAALLTARHPTEQDNGANVSLAPGYAEIGDAAQGPLQPGDIGIVVGINGADDQINLNVRGP
eukprot:SAG11_NODE_13329_length_660_cov_0.540107_1_plen_176_part_01